MNDTKWTPGPMEFDAIFNGYRFIAKNATEGDSRVEISKDGKVLKSFLWPTYKIYNIAAHAADITDDIERGLMIAGATGFGGNVYQPEKARGE